jgi:nucleotide-binding universal stress UspA family protein
MRRHRLCPTLVARFQEHAMIKSVLVPATGTDADDAVFAAALTVARQFTGYLDVLHVRVDAAEAASALVSDVGVGMVSSSLIDRLEEESAQIEERAFKLFRSFCARQDLIVDPAPSNPHAVSASWHREVGRESHWLAEYGRTSDIVVVGRPIDGRGVMPETLEAALFESGRPLLIPNTVPKSFKTIAIAWKPTRESARAVAVAMPFLEQAKRIVILTVTEHDRVDRDSAARLLATLKRHDLSVEAHHLQPGVRSTAETLLAAANEVDAGLLVMGGYGHNRFRELVFGGVTEHVIKSAGLAVLMAH